MKEFSIEFLVDGEVVHSAKTEATNLKMSSMLTIGSSISGSTTRVKLPAVAAAVGAPTSNTASLAGKKRGRANTRTGADAAKLPLLMNKSDDECDDDELIDKLE